MPMPMRRLTRRRLPCRQRAGRLLASASLSALLLTGAQAADNPVTRVLGPGVWTFTTPQVYGPDDVLDLHGTGEVGCSPCYPLLVFQTTVSFGGTLKLTLPDNFLPYGGQALMLFVYQGNGMPGSGLPSHYFDHFDLPALPPDHGWNTDSLYTSGRLLLTAAVPEPAMPALWLAGLAGIALLRRRRA